jgi:hypothetical protein
MGAHKIFVFFPMQKSNPTIQQNLFVCKLGEHQEQVVNSPPKLGVFLAKAEDKFSSTISLHPPSPSFFLLSFAPRLPAKEEQP